MATLSYVGRSPDSDGIIVPKSYADAQSAAMALTTGAVNTQIANTQALLTTQSYVDNQDALLAKKAAVTSADTAYVATTLLNAANGVAGLDSSGNLFTAQLPTGIPTDRVATCYSMAPSVAFEAVGTTAAASGTTSTNSTTITGSHTSAGGVNTVVLCYVDSVPNGSAVGVPGASVTYGGVAMTLLGTPITYQVPGTASAFGGVFYLFNPPAGAKPVVSTLTGSGSITWFSSATTISYTNVGSLGSLVTNTDFNQDTTTTTLNGVPCQPRGLISMTFAETSNAGGSQFTGCNQTIRYNNTAGGSTGMYMLLAEAGATGASSYNFTGTIASAVGWGALAVPLNPATLSGQTGVLTYAGASWTATGSATQQLASMTVADPGYPWRPWPFAFVQGASSGATQPTNRMTGTGSYGLLTVLPSGGTQVYGAGICTGSFYPDIYPVLPYATTGQTPTSVPPITGGLELDLIAQLWSGSTFTFYPPNLVYNVWVIPAL